MRWGLGDFVWVWVVGIVAQIVIASVVLAIRGLGAGHEVDAVDIAAVTAGSAAVTVALLALVATRRGRGSLRADFGFVVRLADWPWLVAGPRPPGGRSRSPSV